MTQEDFITQQINKYGDFGIFLPPTTEKEALQILAEHFLGKDWYSNNPISTEQINTEIVCLILEKTETKKWYKKLFNI